MKVSDEMVVRGFGILNEADKPSGWEHKPVPTNIRRRLAAAYIRQDPVLARSLIAILGKGEYPTSQMRFSVSLWIRDLEGREDDGSEVHGA